MGTADPVVVAAATGCLEVSTTIYPYTSWNGSYIHTAFENAAATLSGVETAFRSLKKQGKLEDNVKFIAFGGDGGTYDIGLQSLSGAMERGHNMLYVCYDNGAYMNTGFQRSGATPVGAWTTTSPVGKAAGGQDPEPQGPDRDHDRPRPALRGPGLAARPARPRAQGGARRWPPKARRSSTSSPPARAAGGPTAPRRSTSPARRSTPATGRCSRSKTAQYKLTYRPREKQPLIPWLKKQGRFAHLFKPAARSSSSACRTGSTTSGSSSCASAASPPRPSGRRRRRAPACRRPSNASVTAHARAAAAPTRRRRPFRYRRVDERRCTELRPPTLLH